MFKFKLFQKEDLARMALTTGGVFGWDTGLGKTIAIFIWPLLKIGMFGRGQSGSDNRLQPTAPVLLVAPGDLHDQISEDGRKLFKTAPVKLDSQATFLRISSLDPATGARRLPPGYYITSFTQLTGNGVADFPELAIDPAIALARLNLKQVHVEEHFNYRAEFHQDEYDLLKVSADDSLAQLTSQYRSLAFASDDEALRANLAGAFEMLKHFHTAQPKPMFRDLTAEQKRFITGELARYTHRKFSQGIGSERYGSNEKLIKCIYSPTLVDLAQDCFQVVVIDEATAIQGEETIIGTGTRQLNPPFRLVCTATPIKNRLPAVFRLAWWGTGGRKHAHGRFPYEDSSEARDEFASEFMISERNITREEERGGRFKKLTPQVCNVHRLWKLFAPSILRRRKKDCGEDIFPKHRHVIRVPMGVHQAAAYKFHIEAEYLDHKGRPAIGPKLTALRIAAADPSSALLKRPDGDGTAGNPRSQHIYIPKLATTLSLVRDILRRREQVIVFHAFRDSIDVMSARLNEAGVPHLVMDGRTSPAKRGRMAALFKAGPGGSHPVMLANSDCMAVGHSFPLCSNVIHYSFPWALDKILQSDDRVHRINSVAPVNSYRMIATSSIDLRMEEQGREKEDAAELVLDGRLIDKHIHELNPAEWLRNAERDFSASRTGHQSEQRINEQDLVKKWPALRAELAECILRSEDKVIPFPVQKKKVSVQFSDLPLWRMASMQ